MRATPLISATWASAAVFLLTKLAVMPIASLPLSSLCLNPVHGSTEPSLGKKKKRKLGWRKLTRLNMAAAGSLCWVFFRYVLTARPCKMSTFCKSVNRSDSGEICVFVSPSGTNLPPPAEMKTSNWKFAAGWEPGCSLAIQPVRNTPNFYVLYILLL